MEQPRQIRLKRDRRPSTRGVVMASAQDRHMQIGLHNSEESRAVQTTTINQEKKNNGVAASSTRCGNNMLDVKSESATNIAMAGSVDPDLVPILIATYLPVEICVYYQVVPVSIDGSLLYLGMVDTNDVSALDYVGKMLAFSELKIQVRPLTFEEHQELVAYYFNNPPSPAQIAAYKQSLSSNDDTTDFTTATETLADTTAAAPVDEDTAAVPPPSDPSPESTESVQQLLNSILRRALDEQADRILIDVNDDGSCRVRYRQQGILRDLFKDLSDAIRTQLILNLKQMLGMGKGSSELQSAAVEKAYRGQPLVLQLKIIVHQDKERAILNILQGDALGKYQFEQNKRRVTETLAAIERAQQELDSLYESFNDTVEKVQRYSGTIQPEWSAVAPTLEALMQRARQVRQLQKAWVDMQKP
ncbi:MAG: hypothetical protein AAGJ55_00500 [Cyanobacteria bacterium J06555_12]